MSRPIRIASDVGGDTLAAVIVSGPTQGVLVRNTNGSYTYKGNGGAVDSNVTTVNLTVTAVNDAPVTNLFSVTFAQDGILQISERRVGTLYVPTRFGVVHAQLRGQNKQRAHPSVPGMGIVLVIRKEITGRSDPTKVRPNSDHRWCRCPRNPQPKARVIAIMRTANRCAKRGRNYSSACSTLTLSNARVAAN